MRIDADTRVVALLGHPVEHSLSPLIHNTAFEAQTVNAVYVATPVRPEDLADAVAGLRALHFLGANVTLPHKQAILPLLDACTERAEAVGAVNTVVRDETGTAPILRGDNTDVPGFLAPLKETRASASVQGGAVLIFGSGGAARAVAYAVLQAFAPSRLTLAARSPDKAERLAEDLAAYDPNEALCVVPMREAGPMVRTSHLLVNATPLGMYPHTDGTPWSQVGDISPEHVVYDLVYNPEETRFLREAAARGAITVSGLEMLIAQAAAAYRQWTDQPMPVKTVRTALYGDKIA